LETVAPPPDASEMLASPLKEREYAPLIGQAAPTLDAVMPIMSKSCVGWLLESRVAARVAR
jgi:hypothetical protein